MTNNMTFKQYQSEVMGFVNELALAHRNSTPETWSGLRDAVLSRHGMLELNFLEFEGKPEDTEEPALTTVH